MQLASDYIHPYNYAGGRPARCRVRIYLPDDMRIDGYPMRAPFLLARAFSCYAHAYSA
jgi:hypothetical protein